MSGEAIEIEYRLTVDDYAKFSADWHITPKLRKKHLKLFFWSCFYCLCLFEYICYMGFRFEVREGKLSDADIYSYHMDTWFSGKGIVPILIMILVYGLCYSKNRIYWGNYRWVKNIDKSEKNRAWLSPQKIILTQDSVNLSSPYVQSEYKWNGFESVQLQAKDLCLFISARSALFIPARFFKSEEEKQRIYEQCQKWWRAAQQQTPESGAV